METWEIWILVGGIIIALLFVLWFIRKKNKEKNELNKIIKGNIPPDIMKVFEDAENEMKRRLDGNLSIDPYDIMWSLANKKRLEGGESDGKEGNEAGTETRTETSEAYIRTNGGSPDSTLLSESGDADERSDEVRGDIQDRDIETSGENSQSVGIAKSGKPKGRPVTGKYKDDDGNPINVFQWRKLQRIKEEEENKRLMEEVNSQIKSEQEVQNGKSNTEDRD